MSGVVVTALAFAASLVLALPSVLARWPLPPDAVEYLGIAWSWVSGAGFVDPVLYSYYLPSTAPPVPALVMRAPLVPVLLAAPLALGSGLHGAVLAHAVLAAAVGAAGVPMARRIDGAAAAAAFAVGFCLAWPWLLAIEAPLTEAASVGMLLALVLLAPRALRSSWSAAGFGALVALAWLTRPNLAVALPAFLGAGALVLGPRRALASRPLWVALLAFVALQQAVGWWCRSATGFPPYEHYKVLLETTRAGEAFFYAKRYHGWLPWVRAHRGEVAAVLAWNARTVAALLFTQPDYHYVGWAAVPALVSAWRRRDGRRFDRLFLAALALALLAVVLVSWGAIDPRRLLVPAALCLWLLAAGWLAALARQIVPSRLVVAAPALLLLAVWALSPSARGTAGVALRAARAVHTDAARVEPADALARAFCPSLDRDALVASPDPWRLYLACGNAGWVLPPDLTQPALLRRYLDERAPGYLVVPRESAAPFDAEARLARVATARGAVLYALRDPPPRSRPWHAPPPLAPR